MATKKKAPASAKTTALIAKWKAFVESVEQGYGFGLYDYRNDLDVRSQLGAQADVADLDKRFQAVLTAKKVRSGRATRPALSGATAIPRRPTPSSSRT